MWRTGTDRAAAADDMATGGAAGSAGTAGSPGRGGRLRLRGAGVCGGAKANAQIESATTAPAAEIVAGEVVIRLAGAAPAARIAEIAAALGVRR